MNLEFDQRLAKAHEVTGKLKCLLKNILLVGSVAYNPNAVTSESDLDLVGICDFSSFNFNNLYEKLGLECESDVIKLASEQKINVCSFVWAEEFEIGLHLWDNSAFYNVINLRENNQVFKRKNLSHFVSTADMQTLRNLKGSEMVFDKRLENSDETNILNFPIYRVNCGEFYPNIQLFNLLLAPKILVEENSFISEGLKVFHNNLQIRLNNHKPFSNKNNLYNALPDKLKTKIGEELKGKLMTYVPTL